MPSRSAYSFTTCQTTFSVTFVPQTLPFRQTQRNNLPCLIFAVLNQSSRVSFTQSGTVNVRLAAVRRLAYEAADIGLLSPELAAGIRRVKGAKKLGMRLGNWLTVEEARSLWQLPNPHAQGKEGSRHPGGAAWLWIASRGTDSPDA